MVNDLPPSNDSDVAETADGFATITRWLMVGFAGFLLAGAFVFRSEWTLWKGMGLGVGLLFVMGWHRDLSSAWRGSQTVRAGVLWLVLMLGISFGLGGLGENEAKGYQSWCWGGAGLAAWWVMLFHTGRDEGRTRLLGWFVVGVATLSALISIGYYGFMKPDWHWGRRLGNCLVYGGWNQVCSGVTWAFAAVWALLLGLRGEPSNDMRRLAWVCHGVLVFAALASLSRGALLVIVAGHVAALSFAGWKAGAGWALIRFLAVFACLHVFLPNTVPEPEEGARFPRVIDGNPLKEWSRRADTGRFEMYEAVFQTLRAGGPRYWLIGDGQWGMNRRWNHSIEERPQHPHSVFVATALQGGLAGLAGLLIVLGSGLHGAICLARLPEGWVGGVVLALAGMAGVVFDGHSVASLDTIPRFEPLILWPGLLLAAGRLSVSRNRNQGTKKILLV